MQIAQPQPATEQLQGKGLHLQPVTAGQEPGIQASQLHPVEMPLPPAQAGELRPALARPDDATCEPLEAEPVRLPVLEIDLFQVQEKALQASLLDLQLSFRPAPHRQGIQGSTDEEWLQQEAVGSLQ